MARNLVSILWGDVELGTLEDATALGPVAALAVFLGVVRVLGERSPASVVCFRGRGWVGAKLRLGSTGRGADASFDSIVSLVTPKSLAIPALGSGGQGASLAAIGSMEPSGSLAVALAFLALPGRPEAGGGALGGVFWWSGPLNRVPPGSWPRAGMAPRCGAATGEGAGLVGAMGTEGPAMFALAMTASLGRAIEGP